MNDNSFPRLIYVTHQESLPASLPLLEVIEQNLQFGVKGIYLREKKLPRGVFQTLASAVQKLCERYQATLILPADASFLADFPQAYLQCGTSTVSLEEAKQKWGKARVLGYSAHGRKESKAAEHQGADYLFFSPVYSTSSKPSAKAQGIKRLEEVCQHAKIPVYALGGIAADNFHEALQAGAYGLAGISVFQEPTAQTNCQTFLKSF